MRIFWSAVATRLLGIKLVACVGDWSLRPEVSQAPNVVVINQDLGLVGEVTGYKRHGYKLFLNTSAVSTNLMDSKTNL